MSRKLELFARKKHNIRAGWRKQTTLEPNLTLEERIKICHSRIPEMRHIEGFLNINLIAPLPIWSPVPEKYRIKYTQDDWAIWGLEAQHPKYLPAILQPFVIVNKHGKGKRTNYYLSLLAGAYATKNKCPACHELLVKKKKGYVCKNRECTNFWFKRVGPVFEDKDKKSP